MASRFAFVANESRLATRPLILAVNDASCSALVSPTTTMSTRLVLFVMPTRVNASTTFFGSRCHGDATHTKNDTRARTLGRQAIKCKSSELIECVRMLPACELPTARHAAHVTCVTSQICLVVSQSVRQSRGRSTRPHHVCVDKARIERAAFDFAQQLARLDDVFKQGERDALLVSRRK